MKPLFLLRLLLDSLAAGLLLFAFAYYWQGNAAHESAGMAMFGLLGLHGLFHRRWFASPAQARRGRFNRVLAFALLAGMLVLLGSSLLISETLFSGLRLDDDFTLRQLHAGIAYWLLVLVAIHLGLRWPMLMAVAAKLFRVSSRNVLRTAVLRAMAAAITVQGVHSVLVLNLRYRLLFQMTLDWWNFEASALGFFGHCMAIAGMCMSFTYYGMQWQSRYRRVLRA